MVQLVPEIVESLGLRELTSYCALEEATKELLQFAMADLNLSACACDRILKAARTIAGLAGMENNSGDHVSLGTA